MSLFRWTRGRLAWLYDPAYLPPGYVRLYEWLVWRVGDAP